MSIVFKQMTVIPEYREQHVQYLVRTTSGHDPEVWRRSTSTPKYAVDEDGVVYEGSPSASWWPVRQVRSRSSPYAELGHLLPGHKIDSRVVGVCGCGSTAFRIVDECYGDYHFICAACEVTTPDE